MLVVHIRRTFTQIQSVFVYVVIITLAATADVVVCDQKQQDERAMWDGCTNHNCILQPPPTTIIINSGTLFCAPLSRKTTL